LLHDQKTELTRVVNEAYLIQILHWTLKLDSQSIFVPGLFSKLRSHNVLTIMIVWNVVLTCVKLHFAYQCKDYAIIMLARVMGSRYGNNL